MSAKRKSSGFTLIELLVVVAIIALLIAILLPSLGRAKANATRVKCAAQLKQWGMVINMYAQENDSWFGLQWIGSETPTPIKRSWSGIATGTPNIYDAEWPSIDTNINMSKYAVIMRTCPGDPLFGGYQAAAGTGNSSSNFARNTRPPVDYTMVRYFPIYSGSPVMWRTTAFDHPGTTMLLCDSPTVQYNVGNSAMKTLYAASTVGVATGGDLDSEPGQTLSQALDARHMGTGNVAFMDGHVEQAKYQDYVNNIPSASKLVGTNYVAVEPYKVWTTIATQ